MLIAISGIDCSGKTTQIEYLVKTLESQGRKPIVFWFRPGYSRELNLLKDIARQVIPSALPNANDAVQRDRIFSKPGVSRTWIAAAITDMVFQYAAKLRALQKLGYTVICDRYIDDAMLDLAFRFEDIDVTTSVWSKFVYKISPTPDANFLLTLPHADMLRRMKLKDEPFPDPEDIRNRRFHAYQEMAKTGRFTVVDAGLAIDEVHRAIRHKLKI